MLPSALKGNVVQMKLNWILQKLALSSELIFATNFFGKSLLTLPPLGKGLERPLHV
jgi:hypothetical protein